MVVADPFNDDKFWPVKIKGFSVVIGALVIALSLVLLLIPVSTRIVDAPCGSVLVPTKVHYLDRGELVFGNTSPCREARMDRLPVGVGVGVAGLLLVVVSLVTGRRRD